MAVHGLLVKLKSFHQNGSIPLRVLKMNTVINVKCPLTHVDHVNINVK